jgi:hypothetical protein
MKTQNQIGRENSRGNSTSQGKKPKTARNSAPITIVATPRMGLLGVIQHRGSDEKWSFHTGPLVWSEAQFQEALVAGRFLVTTLTESQRIAATAGNRRDGYRTFLQLATNAQLLTLRDSIPLYWIETLLGKKATRFVSLRGKAPAGSDRVQVAWKLSLLAIELKKRKLTAEETLHRTEDREAKFASIARCLTALELQSLDGVLEEIIALGSAIPPTALCV